MTEEATRKRRETAANRHMVVFIEEMANAEPGSYVALPMASNHAFLAGCEYEAQAKNSEISEIHALQTQEIRNARRIAASQERSRILGMLRGDRAKNDRSAANWYADWIEKGLVK